jgi:hypothetical protein
MSLLGLAVGLLGLAHVFRDALVARLLPLARERLRRRFGDGTELAGARVDAGWTLTVTGLRVPLEGGVLVEVEEARIARVLAAVLPGGLARVRVLDAKGHVVWVGDEGPFSSFTVPVTYVSAGASAAHPVDGRVEVASAAWAHRREELGAPPAVIAEAGLVAGPGGVRLSAARVHLGDTVVEGEAGTDPGGGVAARATVRQLAVPVLDHLIALIDPAFESRWPAGVAVEGECERVPGGAVRVRARVSTAESALTADLEVAADRELTGRLTGKLAMVDALAMGLFPSGLRPLPSGEMMLDARFEGTTGAPVVAGTAFTPAAELAAGPVREFPVYRFADSTVTFRLEREKLAWKDLSTKGSSGTVTGSGSVDFGIWPARHETDVSWEGVRVEQIPTGPGGEHALTGLLRAAATGRAHVAGEGGDLDLLRADGEMMLEEPEYQFLRKAEPALAGYGLPAPSWKGTGPCRCRIVVADQRLEISDIAGRLDGLAFSGRMVIALDGAVSGRLTITLEPSYLKRSKTLAVGAVLGPVDVPVSITGTLTSPTVSVDVAEAIGGLLGRSRMGSAVAQAARQLFKTEEVVDAVLDLDDVFERILSGDDEADRLVDRLVASGMTEDELKEKLADYRRRRGKN